MIPDQAHDSYGDDISLRPYVDAVLRYRRIMGALLGAVALLFGLGTLYLYLKSPVERVASLQFRLLFAGAEDKKYPNGQPFNPTEVVAPPVIAAVFEANQLSQYGKLHDFQQSVFLLHSNLALQQLDFSYQAKLSDPQLTPVDRARIEEEFLRRREAIRIPEYTLSYRRTERFRSIPDSLMEKVLTDVLDTWARQADALKGVARPPIELVTREVFQRAASEQESLLVRIDILRSGARRILSALEAMDRIPGARTVRTSDGRSVAAEKAAVEDILRFDLEPLKSLTRASGGGLEERPALLAYVANQVVTNRLAHRVAMQRAQTLQTSLREYMAQRGGRVEAATSAPAQGAAPPAQAPQQTIPTQFGDSFIDRLMEMSAASHQEEREYRQELTDQYIEASSEANAHEREVAYYEDLLKQISTPSITVSRAGGQEALLARFNATVEALNQSVDRVQKLYEEIAVQTLNPSRRLYTVTQPVRIDSTDALQWQRIFLFFILTLALTLLGAIVIVLLNTARKVTAVRPRPEVERT